MSCINKIGITQILVLSDYDKELFLFTLSASHLIKPHIEYRNFQNLTCTQESGDTLLSIKVKGRNRGGFLSRKASPRITSKITLKIALYPYRVYSYYVLVAIKFYNVNHLKEVSNRPFSSLIKKYTGRLKSGICLCDTVLVIIMVEYHSDAIEATQLNSTDYFTIQFKSTFLRAIHIQGFQDPWLIAQKKLIRRIQR
ncbi:hypothetical protein PHYBLDRAFT_59708 [Phycomyces blakesleeanus NRRL 1555(-)]|uniref:Uncharacterized protein n=1 Tax=Phycomyces blakesleeanus (strain ATCC 8743b / DSM 1359 / FGSC 10004 / NBRC 33097 / NRRL 1555) TaxID=763407 RepID=A0A162UH11_PHYB8|nr:hypothetical protein PHYBLDRAFT_59708 [Phycomyces blakesleeanus NRRL 1555(-)]OAD76172.1 hypothetical protein PHYBLDRAFT_59708 [Phycomyces blakesleeanus NRRL 1555(-)]|eukprot:XP_018294212.1 hypothetical protein PHYBLDRAFT_59708 [Phycomyces blakesleeanus NRRL 1555(-)]